MFTGSTGAFDELLCYFPVLVQVSWAEDSIRANLLSSDGAVLISAFFQGCSPGWSLPIKAMIKSLPLWGILVFHFTQYWIFNILIMYLPTYFNSVLQANFRDVSIEKVYSILLFKCLII